MMKEPSRVLSDPKQSSYMTQTVAMTKVSSDMTNLQISVKFLERK